MLVTNCNLKKSRIRSLRKHECQTPSDLASQPVGSGISASFLSSSGSGFSASQSI